MDHFELLGSLALRLHSEFRTMYYLLLPIFFALSLVFAWFRHPQGGPDFIESVKRAFVATLLLVGFAEITDTILFVSSGIATKVDDMNGLESFMKMAGEKAKSYTLSPTTVVLAFNDLLVAVLAFLSYIVLYVARYIVVAIYHFSWVFLSIIAPILLLFHVFSSRLTVALFRSMIEIASWKVVWSVLSAMLTALPFGNAYMTDGNYLTVIVLNFVIALCMLGTPLVVHALVGSGLSGMTGALGPAVAGAMLAAPAKAATMTTVGREMLTSTASVARNTGAKLLPRLPTTTLKSRSIEPNLANRKPKTPNKPRPIHPK